MWKLKIADGGNNPYIYSTNNFVGRQIWKFEHKKLNLYAYSNSFYLFLYIILYKD